jgi:hypothetical protein
LQMPIIPDAFHCKKRGAHRENAFRSGYSRDRFKPDASKSGREIV